MSYKISVVVEKDDSGYFVYSPELPGCFSQGENYEEALVNIKEAIELYLETIDSDERKKLLSRQISTSSLEVSIA